MAFVERLKSEKGMKDRSSGHKKCSHCKEAPAVSCKQVSVSRGSTELTSARLFVMGLHAVLLSFSTRCKC